MLVICLSGHQQSKQIGVRLGAANGTSRWGPTGLQLFRLHLFYYPLNYLRSTPYYLIPYSILFRLRLIHTDKQRSEPRLPSPEPGSSQSRAGTDIGGGYLGLRLAEGRPDLAADAGFMHAYAGSAPSYASPKRVGAGEKRRSAVRF